MTADTTMEPSVNLGKAAVPSAVLCFAGAIGSGKTTLSIAVANQLKVPRVSFGEYLRWLAGKKNVPVTRESLQDLGNGLINRELEGFCRSVLMCQPWRSGVPLVVDGIRHLEALQAITDILTPAPGYLIYIQVDRVTQVNRLLQDDLRHEGPLEVFEAHPTEQQVQNVLYSQSALVLDGTRPVKDLTLKVVDFLEKQARADWSSAAV